MCVSKPKIPTPTPVVERQAYKNAPSRASLSSGDSDARRRAIMGVATSAQGVNTQASTTKRVRTGGDQPIGSVLGGAPASPTIVPAPIVSTGATTAPQTRTRNVAAMASTIKGDLLGRRRTAMPMAS